MRYFLDSAGQREFDYSGYPGKKTQVSFGPVSISFTAGPVELAVKEWQTPRLGATRIQYRAREDLAVTGEDPNELITLCFMSKGKTSYQCRHIHTTGMTANTNNFFYLPDVRLTYQLEKDETGECFKICFTPDYMHAVARWFPSPFALLEKKIEQHRPFELGTTHFITTPEINRIIRQIIYARQMGGLAPLYLESKVLEMLVLQWQCVLTQNATGKRCFLHHRDQINMARNLIEDSYRNPPGIHELAKRVGMSETLLKADFKAAFGTTIFAYLFNYRMDMAQRFLEDPSLTISDIADQLGYKSLPHFTTSFKRKFDMPPLEYRKTNSLQPSGPGMS